LLGRRQESGLSLVLELIALAWDRDDVTVMQPMVEDRDSNVFRPSPCGFAEPTFESVSVRFEHGAVHVQAS
jgi:hypothetical protein